MAHCLNRRLSPGIFLVILFSVPVQLRAQHRMARVAVTVDTAVTGTISPEFMGFGYEKSAVAQKGYFDPGNAVLIRLYHNLSPHGLIRIGGNVSDHTSYIADGSSAPNTERETTFINHHDLVDLAAFVRATGWQVMWGLNLGTGSPAAAATEALAVDTLLGSGLQSFQIGNEVDLQSNYSRKYNVFDAYYEDYLTYREAVEKTVSGAPFSGPDVAGNLGWFRAFAGKEKGRIKLLTFHYYRMGAHNPKASIGTLLGNDTGWNERLGRLQQISHHQGTPYRINEVNSFSGGGKTGVSDVFASALWSLDYMFNLASRGCQGINLETDINQLGWISHYSPVVHDASGHCSVRPEYYGMLAFSLAGKGELLKLGLKGDSINLSAYATRTTDRKAALWVTVVNKDLSKDARVIINLPGSYQEATAFRLSAPSVGSRDQVTLAGKAVSPDGRWSPGKPEKIPVRGRQAGLPVPHASAVLLRFFPEE